MVDYDAAAVSRRMMREAATAALSTLDRETGKPFGSLVLIATLPAGSPVTLISALAEHTKNIEADPAAALLIDGTRGLEEPMAGARVSLSGRMVPTDTPAARPRFLARHPSAAEYADFRDFRFVRFEIERAHLVAGFGRITGVEPAALLLSDAECAALGEQEADILEHMNEEHADAIQLYAAMLGGVEGGGWIMTGLDPEGFDLVRGAERLRIPFEEMVRDASHARAALVSLVKRARALQ